MAFIKHGVIGLPIVPSNNSLSFNLSLALNLDHCECNYFDNIWANNRKPSFPAILTQFANYLHSKNLRIQLDDPNLRPQFLDRAITKSAKIARTHQATAQEGGRRNKILKR